jgi:hypothetical protein
MVLISVGASLWNDLMRCGSYLHDLMFMSAAPSMSISSLETAFTLTGRTLYAPVGPTKAAYVLDASINIHVIHTLAMHLPDV